MTAAKTKLSLKKLKLTASQINEIKKSKAQAENGKFIEQSQLDVQTLELLKNN